MKRLLLTTATFAAIALLVPQVGMAAWMNQVGIYTDQAGDPLTANVVAVPNVPFNAYLVLTNPQNDTYNGGTDTARPIVLIDGWEAQIQFPEEATFFKLSETFPAQEINIGSGEDYVVGFASSVPVVGVTVVLCTWQFMVTDTDPHNIFLDHTRFDSLDGFMAVVDAQDPEDANLSPMHVSTGDVNIPVFSINGNAAVAVETESWGDVKALFR